MYQFLYFLENHICSDYKQDGTFIHNALRIMFSNYNLRALGKYSQQAEAVFDKIAGPRNKN